VATRAVGLLGTSSRDNGVHVLLVKVTELLRRSGVLGSSDHMKTMTVIVLATCAVCVLAVALAVLLVPSLSWAAVSEWLTTTPLCEAPCQ
jgi:predicted transporter